MLNACHLNSADGQLNSIEGYAYRPVEAEEGKLKVVFDSVPQSSDGGSCKKIDFTCIHTCILCSIIL